MKERTTLPLESSKRNKWVLENVPAGRVRFTLTESEAEAIVLFLAENEGEWCRLATFMGLEDARSVPLVLSRAHAAAQNEAAARCEMHRTAAGSPQNAAT